MDIKIVSDPYNRSTSFFRWENEWVPITPQNESGSRLHDEAIAEGFFPFKAGEIVDILLREYQVGDDVLSILFEGADDEYDELCAVCALDHVAPKVQLQRSDCYLRNAQDVLPEIVSVFDAIRPLVDKRVLSADPTIATKLERFEDVAKDTIPLCVIGSYSSGKSMFINALIGQELLPTGDEPITSRIYQIRCSPCDDLGRISFDYDNERVRLDFDNNGLSKSSVCEDAAFLEYLDAELVSSGCQTMTGCMNRVLSIVNAIKPQTSARHYEGDVPSGVVSDRIDIEVPFFPDAALTRAQNYLIFDTPGEGSLTNGDHSRVLGEAMEGLSNGLPIYVSTYDTLDNFSNQELVRKIKHLEAVDERFALIVVNKADAANIKPREYDEEKRQQIREMAVPHSLFAQGVFFVSSIMGLGAKLEGEFMDDVLYEIYDEKHGKYSNPRNRLYKTLYQFNIQPAQMEERCMRESAACPDLVLANSGLYCVEREIDRFATHYSAYNKCQMSRTLIAQIMESVKSQLEAARLRAEKIREHRSQLLDSTVRNALGEFERYRKESSASIADRYFFYVDRATTPRRWYLKYPRLQKRQLALERSYVAGRDALGQGQDAFIANALLEELRSDMDKACANMVEVLEENSREFWKTESDAMRNRLCQIASGNSSIPDEKRRAIEDYIVQYPSPHIHGRSDGLFVRDSLMRVTRFLFFTFRSQQLDLNKVVDSYNRGIEKAYFETKAEVNANCERGFRRWLDSLINHLYTNMADYNPKIRELQEQIEKDDLLIDQLAQKLDLLERCAKDVDGLLGWSS